jgi:hypothetical protein
LQFRLAHLGVGTGPGMAKGRPGTPLAAAIRQPPAAPLKVVLSPPKAPRTGPQPTYPTQGGRSS